MGRMLRALDRPFGQSTIDMMVCTVRSMRLDELLAATQSGDPRARNALADALYARLRSFFRQRCRQGLDAEDMVQITLEAIYLKLDSFVPGHPKAFEYLVYDTANRVLSTKRRSSVRERRWRADTGTTSAAISPEASPSVQAMHSELLEHVTNAIDELGSTDQRTVDAWKASVEWRVQAEREGVERATLRGRLSRALARVREIVRRSEPSTTGSGGPRSRSSSRSRGGVPSRS